VTSVFPVFVETKQLSADEGKFNGFIPPGRRM
jgi:hypothetical protein